MARIRLIVTVAQAALVASSASCAHTPPRGTGASSPPPLTVDAARRAIRCPKGTRVMYGGDVYATGVFCERPDGRAHGPNLIYVDGGVLVGQLHHGIPVGLWQQWSRRGHLIGSYRLDATGSGLLKRWYHSGALEWRGPLVQGKRHGHWTYFRESGAVSMREHYRHGRLIQHSGQHFVSEVDQADSCPNRGAGKAGGTPTRAGDSTARGTSTAKGAGTPTGTGKGTAKGPSAGTKGADSGCP